MNANNEDVASVETSVNDADAGISKRQLKKRKHREAKAGEWKQKKKQKKLDKKEKKRQQREEADKLARESMTEEEYNAMVEKKKEAVREWHKSRQKSQEKTREKLKSFYDGHQTNLNDVVSVCLDCSFNDKMTERELISLSQQLSLCYSLNVKAENPMYLSITSLTPPLSTNVEHIAGSENWLVEKTSDHFTVRFADLLKEKKVIYLSADAEEQLETLENGHCYVIGGIVDRNRHKNLCQNEAQKYGIRTAKLPIGTHLEAYDYSILTTNQCYDMLLTYMDTKSWQTAVEKVMPKRKRKATAEDVE